MRFGNAATFMNATKKNYVDDRVEINIFIRMQFAQNFRMCAKRQLLAAITVLAKKPATTLKISTS